MDENEVKNKGNLGIKVSQRCDFPLFLIFCVRSAVVFAKKLVSDQFAGKLGKSEVSTTHQKLASLAGNALILSHL